MGLPVQHQPGKGIHLLLNQCRGLNEGWVLVVCAPPRCLAPMLLTCSAAMLCCVRVELSLLQSCLLWFLQPADREIVHSQNFNRCERC